MKQKFIGSSRENFLQRRYAVSLGRRYVLTATSVVLLGVIGYSQVSGNPSNIAQSRLSQAESPLAKTGVLPDTKVVAANTKFGFKLFSEIANKDADQNVFVSPTSVAIALAMTYNGASGNTKQAMAKVLEFGNLNLQQINSNYALLKARLENPDPEVQLTMANSLWADKDASLNPEFIARNRDFYQAKVSKLDFGDVGASDTINNWVQQNTRGKIDQIVGQIDPNQLLFLLNAIYFKGSWTKAFDQQQTVKQPFYLKNGEQKEQLMMSQTGDYKYYENKDFQAVSLPYGRNGQVSFYIFLPAKKSNLSDFQQNLNADSWNKWMNQFSKQKGSIRIPRFKIDYDLNLNDALTALGMGEAFSSKADFSQIGANLAISEVKHKTFVEVNEAGTEAAATTKVGIVPLSAPVPMSEPFRMVVDRPFFCAIRDNQTGSIIFMGSIIEPS